MLEAVIEAGADAVYFGTDRLSMRSAARNFTLTEIAEVTDRCRSAGVRAFLTLNTIVYEDELDEVRRIVGVAAEAGVDGVICWDPAVLGACREAGLAIHLSTQAGVSNSASLRAWGEQGVRRCVLARECTLEQIVTLSSPEARSRHGVCIEVFAHGALCVSISGRCYLSQYQGGGSANRGECIQPCRRSYETYKIRDKEDGHELILGNDYVLSPKDLCSLPFLDQLVGRVDALKIEGRARGAEYAGRVVSVYREALRRIGEGTFDRSFTERSVQRLGEVFNRGFSNGHYFGLPGDDFVRVSGSQATRRKLTLGRVVNYYSRVGAAEVEVTDHTVSSGDLILIIGPTTGVVEQRVQSLEIDGAPVERAGKGQSVGIRVETRVRRNDRVYLWVQRSGVPEDSGVVDLDYG